jgi:hypothetical protein
MSDFSESFDHSRRFRALAAHHGKMGSLISRADVVTATPARYAKQLVSHLGRRIEWTTEGGTSTARLGTATGQIVVGDGVLTLISSGPDEADVARFADVLGRHLERFGQRNELAVTWIREPAE